eukprot:1624438-Pyramimonas_sp.AAC.1
MRLSDLFSNCVCVLCVAGIIEGGVPSASLPEKQHRNTCDCAAWRARMVNGCLARAMRVNRECARVRVRVNPTWQRAGFA